MPNVELHLGDCLSILPTLDRASIAAVVSDPPYGMKWDTDCARFSVGNKHHRNAAAGRDWGEPIKGDGDPFDPTPWLKFRSVVLWGSNHFAARLPVGTTLVWIKRNDTAFGSFLSDAEVGWMKGGHGVYCHRDLSMNAIARNRVHPNQKPVGLFSWCFKRLKLKPGDTVLDPYMGSGTTGVACVQMGLNFIGIELDLAHFATAERRIAEAQQATPLLA